MAEVVSTMVQVHVATWHTGDIAPRHLILQRAPEQRLFPNLWQVVTGRSNTGESAVSTALREMQEETGLTPQRLWILPYVASFYSLHRDAIVQVPVFGCIVDALSSVIISHEHQSYQWLDKDPALKHLVIPSQREALTLFDTLISSQLGDELFHSVYEIPLL